MIDITLLFLAGLAGGLIAGLLGVGGGIFYLLVLPLALSHVGVPESEMVQYTIANSLLGTTFAALSGSLAQIKHKNFFLKPVLWVSVGAIIISTLTLYLFVNTPMYSKEVFNIVVIFLLTFILWRTLRKSALKAASGPQEERPATPSWLLGAGGSGGLIAALSGLGGGSIVVPFLNLILKMDIKKAKSISLGMIFFTGLWVTLYNMAEVPAMPFSHGNMGYIVFPVVVPLGLGVIIASPFGVKLSHRLSSRTISILFATFIFVVILKKAIELIQL